MKSAWVIRSGRYGERDDWAIANGFSGGGWKEVPDLTPFTTREDVEQVIADTFGTDSPARCGPFATEYRWVT